MTDHPRRNLYGRHTGRPLSPLQSEIMTRLMACQGFDGEQIPSLRNEYEEIWLEIGIGAGEHLAWQARQNPRVLCLGAEYYLNGAARACKHVEDDDLRNVRLLHGDARVMMDALPHGCLSRAFILHPDPWPKARQWRRRIISTETLDRLAELMSPGAILRMASDHADYQPWIMRVLMEHPHFEWTAKCHEDWSVRPADWPQTRYEAKAIREGRATMYIQAVRT